MSFYLCGCSFYKFFCSYFIITEEKILSNIGKIQKLIDPASKKTIIQLDDDTYFKDLIESIKMYLVEYPNKKTFPESVYSAAYGLVEYATNQFEENTKQIEELIRQREANIMASTNLKDILKNVEENGQNWEDYVQKSEGQFGEDIVTALKIIGTSGNKDTDEYNAAVRFCLYILIYCHFFFNFLCILCYSCCYFWCWYLF